MKKIKVGALISSLLTILTMSVQAQKIYDVDVEVRENSIVINNTALDMIEDERHASAVKILESVLEDDPSFHPAYLNYYRAGRNVDEKVEKVVNVLKKRA